MKKHKSALLLGLLFGVAWAATSEVKTEVYWFGNTVKVESPSYLIDQSTQPTLAMLLMLMVALWLLRDKVVRVLAVIWVTACLMFCFDSIQIVYRSARWLGRLRDFPPIFVALGEQSLWNQLIGASISFSLSALCLWLCARAAGPMQPRPLASWRDWKNWNAASSHQIEPSNS